jgi:hypothetical protein
MNSHIVELDRVAEVERLVVVVKGADVKVASSEGEDDEDEFVT